MLLPVAIPAGMEPVVSIICLRNNTLQERAQSHMVLKQLLYITQGFGSQLDLVLHPHPSTMEQQVRLLEPD